MTPNPQPLSAEQLAIIDKKYRRVDLFGVPHTVIETAELERLRKAALESDLNGSAILECRRVIKEIMGDHCAFIDDDVARCMQTLRSERDALREALKGVLPMALADHAGGPDTQALIDKARAALASTGESK